MQTMIIYLNALQHALVIIQLFNMNFHELEKGRGLKKKKK